MPRSTTMIIAVTVCACAALNVAVLLLALVHPWRLNSDFMAFWSFPRFAAGHQVAAIYSAGALQPFQAKLYPGFGSFYPYLYPPTLLLVIWWLQWFGFGQALMAWTLAGVTVLAAGVVALFPRHKGLALLAVVASPAALLNGVTGETSFFTCGLLLGGLAALPRLPLLAGVAFGLLTLKPQLGVLVPFLLLARGEWRAIAAAAGTAGLLVAISCITFPPGLWGVWAHTLPVYQAQYFSGPGLNLNIIVTPAANLRALGVPGGVAWAVQLLCGVGAAGLVWVMARRGPYEVAVAVLLAAGFLAVPHAYAYDTVTLPAAMALVLSARVPTWQVVLGCLVYLAPLLLLTPARHGFLYAVPVAVLLACMVTCGERENSC